jgi:DNA-binding MarR family transcriptional regulator
MAASPDNRAVKDAGEPPSLEELAAAIDDVAADFTEVWERAHHAPPTPIPMTQLRVLFIVAGADPVNMSGLAAQLGASLPSTSRLCDRLEAGGLLVRDTGQNRREITVRVSRDGAALLEDVRRRRRQELSRALAQMPTTARIALLNGLTHFRTAVRRDPAPAPGTL